MRFLSLRHSTLLGLPVAMINYWQPRSDLSEQILIPKYYDPLLQRDIQALEATHELIRVQALVESGVLTFSTGHEVGSHAYGTGNIPFVRTSDIANWELRAAPKQGVSEAVFQEYWSRQDVRSGDILLVRDGTYLVGTNCLVTELDEKVLYQSHVLKLRVRKPRFLSPYLLFLVLNSEIVQRQVRAKLFTADIIGTLGQRINEVVLPIPKATERRDSLTEQVHSALTARVKGRCFIRQAPLLIEAAMRTGSAELLTAFLEADVADLLPTLTQDTISLEFGSFEATWLERSDVRRSILIPRYYDPEITTELEALRRHCRPIRIGRLKEKEYLSVATGDEPGKMAYGTGDVPFIRTSDFANWELKHDPKHSLSEQIYEEYRESQDVQSLDVLMVRDGTYLVGSSAIIAPEDQAMVYCGGLFKIRSLKKEELDPFLLLGLLNSYIVKRQVRSKQFTRDVIDTLGKRLDEIYLPVPRSASLRKCFAEAIATAVRSRWTARSEIARLAAVVDKP